MKHALPRVSRLPLGPFAAAAHGRRPGVDGPSASPLDRDRPHRLVIRFVCGAVAAVVVLVLLCAHATAEERADRRPNIVLIMVDDMGFSDLGCYGGEISTPNLDRIATEGLRFAQFYNCAKCETTRATLLSGRYHTEVGIGALRNCVTIAEVLRTAGYQTLMTGKWHLGSTPTARGFDRYFGHLSGATNYFHGDGTFRLDDQPFDVPKEGFYTTDANTDFAIRFVRETDRKQPFFLYIAYNAPHYPLQAPRELVEKYRGRYRIGWDELRLRRYRRIQELGLLPDEYPLPPRPADVPAWETLSEEEQDVQDLVMATYAAMIERVDQNIGRLVRALEELGEWDNTLFLFLSDNGACPFQRTKAETRKNHIPPWDPRSYWTYDKGWAHACNTPFREYKRNQHEGGIATPLIAYYQPVLRTPGAVTQQVGHLVDIMATCIDVAGARYPAEHEGASVGPLRGRSLLPILQGRQRDPHPWLFFTFYGTHNALRVGSWKLVNKDRGPWELYDLARDRTELRDLAADQPQRLQQMRAKWEALARQLGATTRPPKGKGRNKRKAPRTGRPAD